MGTEQPKVPIGDLARKIRQVGYETIDSKDPLKREYQNPNAALRIWDIDLKPERFAIIADLVDRAFLRTESKLDQQPPSLKSCEALSLHIKDRLSQAIGEELEFLNDLSSRNSSDPAVRTYDRFLEWVEFHNKYITQTEGHQKCGSLSPQDAITPGINAAINWMGLTLEMIPQVYRRANPGVTPEVATLADIARRSYSLLGKLASYDIVTFNCIGFTVAELEDPTNQGAIDPNSFQLISNRNGPRLDFSETAKTSIAERILPSRQAILQTPRIGCPALVNFGDRSPIAKLWSWYIDMASSEDIWVSR